MSNNNQNNKQELNEDIFNILKMAGFLFPETPSEVEQIELELKQCTIKLPESISDASKAFDLICNSSDDIPLKIKPNISNSDNTLRNLARAAREGGDISDELAKRMQEDRKKARDEINGE